MSTGLNRKASHIHLNVVIASLTSSNAVTMMIFTPEVVNVPSDPSFDRQNVSTASVPSIAM